MENETEEKKGWRRWLVRALFESALIILSIIAALAVNEWRDTRELQSQVRQGRAAFAQEIQANYETLLSEQTGLPYHKRLWRRYQDLGTKPVITIENLSRSAKSSDRGPYCGGRAAAKTLRKRRGAIWPRRGLTSLPKKNGANA